MHVEELARTLGLVRRVSLMVLFGGRIAYRSDEGVQIRLAYLDPTADADAAKAMPAHPMPSPAVDGGNVNAASRGDFRDRHSRSVKNVVVHGEFRFELWGINAFRFETITSLRQ